MPESTPSFPSDLTFDEAQKVLAAFNCVDVPPKLPPGHRSLVRKALQRIVQLADMQIFGICADTAEAGLAALRQYGKALNCAIAAEPDRRGDPSKGSGVYIKCNPTTGLFYLEPYTGDHRGVLVACQSAAEDGVNCMYGHLPLDLFSEG